MDQFLHYPSVNKLKQFSKHPIDLSAKDALKKERLEKMHLSKLGFSLYYGTERIDEQVEGALIDLAKESHAVEQMRRMQAGEILNKIEGYESECRPVLHTATRDFFSDQQKTGPAKEAASLAYAELEKLKGFLEKIDKKFTHLVQIGIGGSDLGPRAIALALNAYAMKGRRAHFISNVDPDDATLVLSELDLKKTLFVVVSKSGTTLETLTNESFVREHLKKAGLDPKEHIIAVTGKGSPMDNPSHYLAAFYIWDYVGGRYSATSMVGAVALGFLIGFALLEEFLKGASEMDKLALIKEPKENLPLFGALLGIWNRNFLHLPTVAVIPYSQALTRFPAHLQQCAMESNGKSIDRQGSRLDFQTCPIVWGEPGTNGQHSFYQLIHQGTEIVPIEFIGFKDSQYGKDLPIEGTTSQEKLLANLIAQSIALAAGQADQNPNKTFLGNRPNHILMAAKLTPRVMGRLLAYYEHKIAFQGFIWNINSFDQEGVQLGKKLATKILKLIEGETLGKRTESFPQAEVYLKAFNELPLD